MSQHQNHQKQAFSSEGQATSFLTALAALAAPLLVFLLFPL